MTTTPVTEPIWICAYLATVITALTPENHPTNDCPFADYQSHRRDPQLPFACGFYLLVGI